MPRYLLDSVASRVLLIRKFSQGFNFRETSHMRSFVKIKSILSLLGYCKFGNFREGFIFARFHMRSIVKIESSRNGKITLSITDIGKSCTSREFLEPQEYLLTLFAKIKLS